MKWFKHISDSLDDPFIFDLTARFGPLGYMVFFGVLEIYAREFKTDPEWKLDITWAYLRTKLQQTRNKRIENILCFLKNSGKWSVVLGKDQVQIVIPKFSKLLDETTKKKLRQAERKSGSAPEKLRTKEEDREEEYNKNPPNPPAGGTRAGGDQNTADSLSLPGVDSPEPKVKKLTLDQIRENRFCDIVSAYPEHRRYSGIKTAWREYKALMVTARKAGGASVEIAMHLQILIGVLMALEHPEWERDGGRYIVGLGKFVKEQHFKRFYKEVPESLAKVLDWSTPQ
jgi:hypothetical protein